MDYEVMYMMEEAMAGMTLVSNISSLVSLAAYVFSALAMYTIAQRREINHAWMAWVPLLNVWILGSIADNYRLAARGQKKNKRKVLLAVNILMVVFTFAATIYAIVTVILSAMGEITYAHEEEVIWKILECIAFFIPVFILGIVNLIVDAIALYDLYSSCDPNNKDLYLVLSLIPGINQIARPVCLFLCRHKDGGLPPKQMIALENPCEF